MWKIQWQWLCEPWEHLIQFPLITSPYPLVRNLLSAIREIVLFFHANIHGSLTKHVRMRMHNPVSVQHKFWCLVDFSNLRPAWNHCWILFSLYPCYPWSWNLFDLPLDYPCLLMSASYLCYWPQPELLTKILTINFVPHYLQVANFCLFLALILLIILVPSCPVVAELSFWPSSALYWTGWIWGALSAVLLLTWH